MKTKYPILLVHGVAIKDLFFLKSFGEIDRILRIEGFEVFKPKTDGFGTIENNAEILKAEIEKICLERGVEKVNIIAHSKGGLDSIYMIEHLGMGDKVASLTTLCTPHKGSPIATNLLRFPKPILKFVAFWVNFWYRIFGDKHPDSYRVIQELSETESIERSTFALPSSIYCQSFSTSMDRPRDDFIMGIPLMFSRYFEKDVASDGVVGVDSATWGEYKGEAFDESVSHSEFVDFMVRKKKKDKIYAFYSALCEDLKERGF